ncbi:unnamed protein product [Arctia plantaginis]|uniref:Uncharacterized protein n=1 Tax=Arctia plantaginis TaxID=874455 RepID=A0A8S0ZFV6_ARCPL|nr:unnamed protein product [Arctia plantaginis]
MDDANVTQNMAQKNSRANQESTGAHNAMSNNEYDVYNEVLPRNKDEEGRHKGKERNDLEVSGCVSVYARSKP